MKTIIVIGALLLLASPILAGNTELDRKQIYELKEKCSQSAQRYFEHEVKTAPINASLSDPLWKYNIRLNTCLLKFTNTSKINETTMAIDILTNTQVAFCATGVNGTNVVEGEYFNSHDECLKRLWKLMNE